MNTELKNNLKSFLGRLCNDTRSAVMFEGDADTLREAIALCDSAERHVNVLEQALRRLTLAARTSGGWEPDADLREACERAERLLQAVTPNVERNRPSDSEGPR